MPISLSIRSVCLCSPTKEQLNSRPRTDTGNVHPQRFVSSQCDLSPRITNIRVKRWKLQQDVSIHNPPRCCLALREPKEHKTATYEHSVFKTKAAEVSAGLKGTSIFLVGMMGSGKTTVGRILADALGYYFFDSDSVVEQAAGGASVATIFSENGEEAFRDAESIALAQLSLMGRLVVATGGGSVIRPSNWGHMRNGVTVWLNVPVEALAKRVSSVGIASRPILCNNAHQDEYHKALYKLSLIFEERQALYTPADAHVSLHAIATEDSEEDASTISPERIALQVLNEINTLIQSRRMLDKARMAHH